MKEEKYDIELIKQVALRDSRYCFVLENGLYAFPVHIYTEDGTKINLKENREKQLKNGDSSYSKKFREDIINIRKDFKNNSAKRLLSFSMEFPIIIQDRRLWNRLLTNEGIPEDDKEFRGRSYFLLDYFFYYPGLVVEIDSDYHDRKRPYDRARDKYLRRKFNLETCRVSKYGESVISERYDREYIRDIILEKIRDIEYYSSSSPFPIDSTRFIVSNYIRFNKGALDFIERLKRYLGLIFEDYDNIVITRKDLECIDPYNFVAGLRVDQETLFLDTISIMLRKIYGKTLYVHKAKSYSLGDVLRITDLISKRLFTWDDICGRIIDPWIVTLAGNPPIQYIETDNIKYKISINPNIERDGMIQDFIFHLEKAGVIHPFWKPSKPY